MEKPQHIRETLANSQAASERSSRCESCCNRPRYLDRRWCRRCILQWQRDPETQVAEFRGKIRDDCRLEGVIPERYRAARMEQLPKAIVAAAGSLHADQGLLLWGSPGVGKTHSLCAITRQLYLDGWDVDRITYEMLMLHIRQTYEPGSGRSELDVLKPLIAVDKLILEDVGATTSIGQQESDFSLRTFLIILDQRLERCLATFVSTNKSVEELGRSFDLRIASRLQEACRIIKLEGGDRRRRQ